MISVDSVNRVNTLGEFVLSLMFPGNCNPDDGSERSAVMAMYPKGHSAIIEYPTDWIGAEMFISCKIDACCGLDDTSREVLEHSMAYASAAFEYQQLTHHFDVVILGSSALLGRRDRAGVVYSAKFGYKQEPAKLARFLWRVSHATPEARATIPPRRGTDYKTLEAWKEKELAGDDYHGVKDFLVGKPTFAASGVIGRGTREYIALSISNPGTPYLESDILLYLNAKGVQNIPTALYHGDVADQRTVSQDLYQCAKPGCRAGVVVDNAAPTREVDEVVQDANGDPECVDGPLVDSGTQLKDRAEENAGQSAEACHNGQLTQEREVCPLITHRYYRLVVREVGLLLKEFPTGRILVWAVRDAFIAHQDAHIKARVMHRDISVGNILIIPPNSKNKKTTYQGLLADWELSKRLGDCAAEAHHPDRTDYPETQVEIADELESFLHVLIDARSAISLTHFMHHYFDDGVLKQETDYTCGLLKATIIKTGELITRSHILIIFDALRRALVIPIHSPWNPRSSRGTTIAALRVQKFMSAIQMEKEKASQEKDAMNRTLSMSRGGSRRGGDRGDHQQPDGWAVAGGATAARQATKAGDLSQFGKINKSTPMTFGPSSVFQKDSKSKSRESTLSRQGSSNMFSMLSANPEITAEVTSAKSSRPPSRKSSIDLGSGGAPEAPPQRRKLQLLPRSVPLENKPGSTPGTSTAASEDEGAESTNEPSMSVEEAKTRIEEDSKEFFSIRDLDEAEVYFTKLPAEHRHLLVDKLVTRAVESKEADAQLVADLFERAHAKNLCSPATFEEGFMPTAEIIDDIAIDAPKALNLFALMLKGAHLHEDEERRARLTSKSMDSEKLVSLLTS
ncbi:hypothetical protein ACG7TL_008751 [Trametes sanguinea]